LRWSQVAVGVLGHPLKTLSPNYGLYGASKAAVEALTIVLSKELQGKSVTVR
jgi:short-subunit dehydrogenase